MAALPAGGTSTPLHSLGSPCHWLGLAAWAMVLVLLAPSAQLQLPPLATKRVPLAIGPHGAAGTQRPAPGGARMASELRAFCPPIPPEAVPSPTAPAQPPEFGIDVAAAEEEVDESQFVSMLTVDRDFFLRVIATKVQCQVVRLKYVDWPRPDTDVCVYSANDDPHASRHLYSYGQWIPQLDISALLSLGPCSQARPFVMVVGTGVGIVPLAAALQGCHVIAFEPWSGNFGRTVHGLMMSNALRCVGHVAVCTVPAG